MPNKNIFSEDILDIANKLIELTNNIGKEAVESEIKNSEFNKQVNTILIACERYRDFLQNQIILNLKDSSIQTTNSEKIIKYGTILIFQLRKFITGENLSFVLSGTAGKDQLREKSYSQDEIFSEKNLRVSFSNAQIELSSCIEKLSKLEETKGTLAEQWKKIIEYGFTENYKNEKTIRTENNEEIYQKKGKDINVYMKFITREKRKTLTYYYLINKPTEINRDELSKGKAYDRGWMYQWLKLNSNIEIDNSDTPLLKLMSAKESVRERVAGIKGGDNKLEQYKYRNRRIITFNNMIDILTGKGKAYYGIIPALRKLAEDISSEDAFSHLVQDFTLKNKSEIKDFVQKRMEELNLK